MQLEQLESADLSGAMLWPPSDSGPWVAILLSARNGERFLQEQLDSLASQSHSRWTLFWRDDGSSDATLNILHAFARAQGEERVQFVPGRGRLGVTCSYLRLLEHARCSGYEYFAFADQDDVWFSDKIARGVRALRTISEATPGIYWARQILVDATLRQIGRSPRFRHAHFRSAMTQNIATGCTIMLNPAGADLVLASRPPPKVWHDWWCYLLISGANGTMFADSGAVLMYRQHARNLIGAPSGLLRRGFAALLRGPAPFMCTMRDHLTALNQRGNLLCPQARDDLAIVLTAMAGGPIQKLRAFELTGFQRQTWLENLLFRLWFITG
jgi:glycosyltransferase involved in cell wall biosynthesis